MGKVVKGFIFILVLVAGYFVFTTFSAEKGMLLAHGPTEVLSKPFPPNHPYQNSLGPSEVVKTLQKGERIAFSGKKVDKDFAFYVVNINGQEGYIMYGGPFSEDKK